MYMESGVLGLLLWIIYSILHLKEGVFKPHPSLYTRRVFQLPFFTTSEA